MEEAGAEGLYEGLHKFAWWTWSRVTVREDPYVESNRFTGPPMHTHICLRLCKHTQARPYTPFLPMCDGPAPSLLIRITPGLWVFWNASRKVIRKNEPACWTWCTPIHLSRLGRGPPFPESRPSQRVLTSKGASGNNFPGRSGGVACTNGGRRILITYFSLYLF